MDMVRVAEFPPDIDVTPVRNTLESHHIPHKFIEENGTFVLYVGRDQQVAEVVELLRKSVREQQAQGPGGMTLPGIGLLFQRTPVTIVCLALSIVGAMIPEWGFGFLHWLTFQDFVFVNETKIAFSTINDSLNQGEYWRLITPVFIHFGIFHIVFNGLWLWEFGRRIEVVAGSLHFLMLVMVIGLVSNVSQYLWSGPSLFGGMSGVIFGLLGYIWIRGKLAPHRGLLLPNGIVALMIGWLVVCMTGVIDLFFQGSIANAAHLSGLLSGMALGAIFGMVGRGRTAP